jgi:hypothetical protein
MKYGSGSVDAGLEADHGESLCHSLEETAERPHVPLPAQVGDPP